MRIINLNKFRLDGSNSEDMHTFTPFLEDILAVEDLEEVLDALGEEEEYDLL